MTDQRFQTEQEAQAEEEFQVRLQKLLATTHDKGPESDTVAHIVTRELAEYLDAVRAKQFLKTVYAAADAHAEER